jgi:hypothetical protein
MSPGQAHYAAATCDGFTESGSAADLRVGGCTVRVVHRLVAGVLAHERARGAPLERTE